jgi:hypothetical protein
MPKDIESYKQDIVDAAVAWQESHPGYPGEKDANHTNMLSGYLYDRVRRYKAAALKEGVIIWS